MKYYEQIDISKIKEIVLNKARYQKVVVLIDANTDLDFLAQLEKQIKKETVYFCLNLDIENHLDIQKTLCDGTRCVVSCLSDYNYLKLSTIFDFNITTIDVFEDKMFTMRLKNYKDYYLFYNTNKLSIEDQLLICNYLIEWKWQNLIASKNYREEEKVLLSIFNRKDIMECNQFYNLEISKELIGIDCKYFQSYLFIRIMAIKYLFLAFLESSQMMIDVYKSYSDNLDQVNYVYKLYKDERVNFLFKNCNKLMLDFINILLSNFSVNFNITKTETNNLLKNIKIKAKNIKKDNLLKYCFLYGIFETI